MSFYFNLIIGLGINILLSMEMRRNKKQIELLKEMPKVDHPFNIYKLDVISYIGLIIGIIVSLILMEVFNREVLGFSLFLLLAVSALVVKLFGEILTVDDNRYKIQ